VNILDSNGATALMWAAHRGYTDAVQALLDAGVDVNVRNRGGYTALMLAEFNGYPKVVQLLKAAGAKE
jgi:ankyrin repeat protein